MPILVRREQMYDWVHGAVPSSWGAEPGDLVAFDKYAAAAQWSWCGHRPRRARCSTGAPNIERVDRLVQAGSRQQYGMRERHA